MNFAYPEFSEVRIGVREVPSLMAVWKRVLCPLRAGKNREREERRRAVYARVSVFEGSPDQLDEMLRQAREVVLPQAKQDEGFKGLIALGDRQSGKTLGITFWESEEAMRASEQDANRLRSVSAKAGGHQIAYVERYEVGLFEVES